MTQLIKARPTIYKGIQMRSRLEAAFAQMLDADPTPGGKWEYEPNAYASPDGQYLPDFVWTRYTTTIVYEVKPDIEEAWVGVLERMHIVLASEPDATLHVVTSSDYETFRLVAQCSPDFGCGECARGKKGDLRDLLDEVGHCGQCHGGWTHLQTVDTYDSRPPENRYSALLTFSCEWCSWLTTWRIEQHKGETYATFETSPGPEEEEEENDKEKENTWSQ